MEINGKKVVDARSPLKIIVTDDDAKKGANKNPSGCAAARAILRSYKEEGVIGARVHLGRVYVEHKDKFVRYTTPENLRTEIITFDRAKTVQFMPGTYTLRPMAPSNRLGLSDSRHKNQSSGTRWGKRKKIARAIHQVEGVRAHGANR